MNNTFNWLCKDDVIFVSSLVLSFIAGLLVSNVWFAVIFMGLIHKLELSVDYTIFKNRHWKALVVCSLLLTFIGAVSNNLWIGYLFTVYLYVPLTALVGPIERRPGAAILTVILSYMFFLAGILAEVM